MNITEAYKTMMKAEPDYLAEKFGLTYSAVTWRKHELKNKKYPSNKKMVVFLEAFGAKKITEEQWELPQVTQDPKPEKKKAKKKEKKAKINAAPKKLTRSEDGLEERVIENLKRHEQLKKSMGEIKKPKSLKEILDSIPK